jgi:hypothetical protein
MDKTHFDRLTREFATAMSRRRALKTLAGAAIALGAAGIAAPFTIAQCASRDETCTVHGDCCGSLTCIDGTCGGPQAGCVGEEATCGGDGGDVCCPGFNCGEDNVCFACGELEEACTAETDCCGSLSCIDGICGGPQAGCVGTNEYCTVDGDCCGSLLCINGRCDDESVGITVLPETGAGPHASEGTSGWLLGAVAVGGAAAVGAARRRASGDAAS